MTHPLLDRESIIALVGFGFGLFQYEEIPQRLKPVEWPHINRSAGSGCATQKSARRPKPALQKPLFQKLHPKNLHPNLCSKPRPKTLLQLGGFGFGLLQDGDVGVGVFPEGEEVLIGGFCFLFVAGHGIRPAQSHMRECA
jgi:hypothetical protein